MNWPIGSGKTLLGLYDLYHNRIEAFRPEESNEGERFIPLNSEGEIEGEHTIKKDSLYKQVLEEALLLKEAGNEFSEEAIAAGKLTPVFFGSALTNFGVQTFLETFLQFAPEPSSHETREGEVVQPTEPTFSGFIFKIQANMDPRHRDRIAFLRICSGKFEKGMDVTLSRSDKKIRLSNSTQFMAESREIVTDAVAGDIIGLYDTGNFQIGDTLYEGRDEIEYQELPQFTPELFMKVEPKNVMKQKSFHKGINQLVQEGAIQLYKSYHTESYIIGAVGQLQFEVFEHRMRNEYNSEVIMTSIGNRIARWVDPEQLDENMGSSRNMLVRDRFDQPLFLFENRFAMRWFSDKYPEVELTSLL